MKCFFGNTTGKPVTIGVPVTPKYTRWIIVENMSQMQIAEGSTEDMDRLVPWLEAYTAVPLDRAAAPFTGLCFSFDAPIDIAMLSGERAASDTASRKKATVATEA